MVLKSHDTDPYSSRIRTYPDVPGSQTRDVSTACQEPYSFRFGLNPCHGNPMSGYVIDTRRVETWKFPYTFRFAANSNVPYTSTRSVNLRLFFSCLSKNCLFHCSKNSFTKCSSRNSAVLDESICTLEPDFPRYYENRLVFRNPKFHGTVDCDIPRYEKFHSAFLIPTIFFFLEN